MVVRFFPSDEERAGQPAGRERRSRPDRAARPSGEAPVAYLPGAAPSEQAAAAVAAVQAVAAADAKSSPAGTGRRATESADEKAKRRANNVSIHQLARRGMSRWELEQVLRKREVGDDVAQAELDRLESVGLLDDTALAVSLVYAARARKGQGRQAIEQELRRRHIAPERITEALADFDVDDELERATELAHKRYAQLRSYDDETAKRRLNGFLARKGYPSETVRAAVSAAMSGETYN